MTSRFANFAEQYRLALGRQVGGPKAIRARRDAARLGQRATALGIETLDLARIHERALPAVLLAGRGRDQPGSIRRASAFFAETITPIEKSHRTAREAGVRFGRMMRALNERGRELSGANRQLRREIGERKSAERSLRRSQQRTGKLLRQSQNMQERLRVLSRQLLRAQEEERMRISRDLHDVIGQTLASINVQLAGLKMSVSGDTAAFERHIVRAERLVTRSVEVVHRFARELRPAVLDDLGLIPALLTFLKEFKARTGVDVGLTASAAVERVSSLKRTVFFRVAQEALSNIAQHARASRAQVKIEGRVGGMTMAITDDGQGFRAEEGRSRRAGRLGILGMTERLEMVGGKLTVDSAPGRGTTVLAFIPVRGPKDKSGPKSKLL